MQRWSRLIVPRLTVLGGLASLAVVLHGLALLQPAPWAGPALVATEGGFVVGWLDGTDDRVPVRVQAIAPDLQARGAIHGVGTGWAAARVVLDRVPGGDTAVRLVGDPGQPPWRLLATIDRDGRPRVRSEVRGPRRSGEIRAMPEPEEPRARRAPSPLGSVVRDAKGAVRARLVVSPDGYARIEAMPHGSTVPPDRIGPATCPGLSVAPCFAAAADDHGVVVAWTRRRALGAELLVSRLGPRRTETVVRRAPSFVMALALAAFIGLVAGLGHRALARGLEAARVVAMLLLCRGWTRVDGRLDDPAGLVAGTARGRAASPYRMRTALAWLQSEEGQRVALRPGTPLVVTERALCGEIPALAASAAPFEHVWVAGRQAAASGLGPYRGGAGRTIRPEIVCDRPLSVLRAAMFRRVAWSVVDAAGLAAIGLAAFAAIL